MNASSALQLGMAAATSTAGAAATGVIATAAEGVDTVAAAAPEVAATASAAATAAAEIARPSSLRRCGEDLTAVRRTTTVLWDDATCAPTSGGWLWALACCPGACSVLGCSVAAFFPLFWCVPHPEGPWSCCQTGWSAEVRAPALLDAKRAERRTGVMTFSSCCPRSRLCAAASPVVEQRSYVVDQDSAARAATGEDELWGDDDCELDSGSSLETPRLTVGYRSSNV